MGAPQVMSEGWRHQFVAGLTLSKAHVEDYMKRIVGQMWMSESA